MEKKTDQAPRTSPFVIEATYKMYRQVVQVVYLVAVMPGIKRRMRLAWASYTRFKRELYDVANTPFSLEVLMLRTVVVETLRYGCA